MKTMELLKYTLMSLFVTCLSVAADPLKQKPQALNSIPAKNFQQQVANELKPDFVPIYLYSRENSVDGDYNFKYETGNGIFAEERGVMLNKGTENEANSVVGSYKYVSPEGVPIEVTYTAGVDGFRAYGAHLPVSPPAASNLPKSFAFKNVAQTAPFARPQFKTDSSDSSSYGRQVFLDDQRKTPLEPVQVHLDQPQVPPTVEQVGAGQTANDVAEQSQNVLFVGRDPTEKPVETIVRATVATADQSQSPLAGNVQDYYQQPRGQPVPELQSRPAPQPSVVQRFEPPRLVAPSVVPVLQTVPQTVQTQPRVVPVLQRLVPGGYQQQQQQQQQQLQLNQFNARPMVQQPPFNQQQPPFNQQQRPGPLRQFSIEPQQMWYMPNNPQGRYFQMPPMQRTLGPPKY
ncbi:uncharacterized protein LOC112593775 [Melanaphis sacchari]|uniref:uncharacterized protein LOC112593775 n=1 Tax=Melanaphis sacchari TaxID=742174 RepID=UPI000DC132CC|nr:uncharacterized protein LOC112593775 [Melanaphis sacchari]